MSSADMRVDQLLPGFHHGDAISHEAMAMRDALRDAGYESDIFCDPKHIGPEVRALARDFHTYSAAPADALIYHYSIHSPLTEWFQSLNVRRILRYHNITPAHYFAGVDDAMALQLYKGQAALPVLARHVRAAICDSSFNAREIEDLKFERTAVLPIMLDFEAHEGPHNRALYENLRCDPRPKVLFVGRLVPNKRQEDLLKVQAICRQTWCDEPLLMMVGSWGSAPRYLDFLYDLTTYLGLWGTVMFPGIVPHEDLLAYYRAADLFLCLSEHEGFCVPLVEAMHHHLPIIAYAAAAVPETLGSGGLLVRRKHLAAIAELVSIVLSDKQLRGQLRRAGVERLRAFEPQKIKSRFVELIHQTLD